MMMMMNDGLLNLRRVVVSARLKGGPRAETRVILVSRAFALMNDDHESESYGVEIEPSVHRNLVLFVEASRQMWSSNATSMLIDLYTAWPTYQKYFDTSTCDSPRRPP